MSCDCIFPDGGSACFQCLTQSFTRDNLLIVSDQTADLLPLSPLVIVPPNRLKVGQSLACHTLIEFQLNGGVGREQVNLFLVVDADTVNPWVSQAEVYNLGGGNDFDAWHIGIGAQLRELQGAGPAILTDVYSSGTAANGGAESESFASLGHPRLQHVTFPLQVGLNGLVPDVVIDPTIAHTFQWFLQWEGLAKGYTAFAFHNKFWLVA